MGFIGGTIAAAMSLIGAGLCVWATMPVEFDLPGSQPDSWEEEIRTNVNLDDALLDQVKNYQGKIKDNREMLKTNARNSNGEQWPVLQLQLLVSRYGPQCLFAFLGLHRSLFLDRCFFGRLFRHSALDLRFL